MKLPAALIESVALRPSSLFHIPSGFARNIFSNAGGNAIHAVVQLGLLFALIRILDDAHYAAFLLATFLVGLLEMASDFGTRIWATRRFSFADHPEFVLRRSVVCKLLFTIVSATAFAQMPSNTLDGVTFLLCILIAFSQPSTDPLLWLLRGRERLDIEAVVVLVCRMSVAVSMLAAAFMGFDLHTLLTVWLIGNVIRMAAEYRLPLVRTALRTKDLGDGHGLQRQPLTETVAYVFPIGAAFVLTSLFQRATIFLLDAFATPQDVKFYGTAFKLVSTSGFVATSIFVSSFATLSRAIETNDATQIRHVVRRKFLLVTAVFLPLCCVGILLSKPLFETLQLHNLTPVADVIILLMPGLYLSCVNMGLKYTLNAFELNWQDFAAVMIGLVVLVGVTVGHGGLTWCQAAALGWCLGEGSLLLIRLTLLWKKQRLAGVPVTMMIGSAMALAVLVCFRVSMF